MNSTTRADMHRHSTASEVSRLGIQRAAGLPECATPPGEVYELAKRRGMDFVTVTDHDTIAGALAIADRPDMFISEALIAHFRGEPRAVHVLCHGVTPDDHVRLQERHGDVEQCAAYRHERGMTCALAHPFYAVGTPLTARHLRRLADLFGNWEVRDGSRAKERNRPAAAYITTHDGIGIGIGIGIGGSDDHAGVDIGRTFTDAGLRERLTLAALASVRNRTWKAALRRLADGYDRVRAGRRAAGRRAAGAREAEVARAT